MYCPKCGAFIEANNVAFCPFCGGKLPVFTDSCVNENPSCNAQSSQNCNGQNDYTQERYSNGCGQNGYTQEHYSNGCGQNTQGRYSNGFDYGQNDYTQERYSNNCDYRQNAPVENMQDSGAAGFGVLGFFFPLAGLILYLVWRAEFPKRAKAAGVGALVSVVSGVVIGVVCGIIWAILAIGFVGIGLDYAAVLPLAFLA